MLVSLDSSDVKVIRKKKKKETSHKFTSTSKEKKEKKKSLRMLLEVFLSPKDRLA